MRLIDADALKAECDGFYKSGDISLYTSAFVQGRINCAPTIDAVPVVRCGECKWFDKTGYEDDNSNEDDSTLHMGYCRVWSRNTQACCFCSHGERRRDD